MSKIAIISDIHSNLAALEEVILDAESQNVSSFACLGDIVGYGPNPSECVSKIQALKCITVKGNHDAYVDDIVDLGNFNPQARSALEWTRGKLSSKQKAWLSALPYKKRLGRNTIVHATSDNPEHWEYIRNRFDASIQLQKQETPICFYGHTHVPVPYEMNRTSIQSQPLGKLKVDPKCKYLVNTGSVGQPRDGDSKASYVVFDRVERTLDFRRVKYNYQRVADEIIENGLPEELAKRLVQAS